jgi:hypothetical protein
VLFYHLPALLEDNDCVILTVVSDGQVVPGGNILEIFGDN